MRRPSPFFPLLVVALLGVSVFLFVANRRSADALRTLEKSERSSRDRYGRAVDDIASIQDSLNAIALSDGVGQMESAPLSAERRLSPNRADEALARVGELRAGIERARDRIAQLEARLRRGGLQVAGLERMVSRLKAGLVAKERLVADLTGRVESLEADVHGLTTQAQEDHARIAEQDDMLEARRRELGTIHYTIGTRRELLQRGVVVARGGVFGLGRTLEPSGQVDDSTFRAVDSDAQTVIEIPATRARVLTPQPPASYTLVHVDGRWELRILDAAEFRTVRHLVIVTG